MRGPPVSSSLTCWRGLAVRASRALDVGVGNALGCGRVKQIGRVLKGGEQTSLAAVSVELLGQQKRQVELGVKPAIRSTWTPGMRRAARALFCRRSMTWNSG